MSADFKLSNRGLSKSWAVQKKHARCYTGGKVVLTKDERVMVCLKDGDVAMVDIQTGQVSSSLQGEVDEVVKETFTTFAVHPDGSEIVTASDNLLLRHWVQKRTASEGCTWICKRSFKSNHTLPIMCMAYDASGTLVATGSNDQSTRVWDVPHGYCTHSFKHQGGNVSVVQFHPDGNRLQLFSATDGQITQQSSLRAYDLNTQKELAKFDDHMSGITSIAFSDDGWTMCSAGRDKVLNFYCTRRWRNIKTMPIYESLESVVTVPAQMMSWGGEHPNFTMCVATGGESGKVRVWGFREPVKPPNRPIVAATCTEIGASEILLDESIQKKYAITNLICRAVHQQIVSVTDDHFFHFWRSSDLPTNPMRKCKQIVGYNDEIIDLKLIPHSDGVPGASPETPRATRVAMVANSDQIRCFDLSTFDCDLLYGHSNIVLACDVSPDGMWLASVSKDQSLRVWNLVGHGEVPAGTCVAKGIGHTEAVGAVCFGKRPSNYNLRSSHTTAWLFTGSKDKTIKSWDLGDVIRKKMSVETSAESIAPLKVRDSTRGHTKDINALCMAPNDGMLASASQDKTIVLWDPQTLSQVGTLNGHKRGVWSVEFSPVDKLCVSAGGDRMVKLWSLKDFRCLKTFEGHMASVLRCYFLSNGMQIMSSGADGLVKLWTIRNGECTNSFDAHTDKIWALSVRSWVEHGTDGDGKLGVEGQPAEMHSQMVSGGGDSIMNVWEDCTIYEAEEEIKKREERIVKEQELHNHVAKRQYRRAIILTLELDFPYKLRQILEELLLGEAPTTKITLRGKSILQNKTEKPDTAEGRRIVCGIVKSLNDVHLLQWIKYVREWNTNGRHSVLAQICLGMVLENFLPDKLMGLAPDINQIFDGIVAYTERHFARVDRLVKHSYLLDHTLASMDVLMAPPNATVEQAHIDSDSSSSSNSSSSEDSSSSDDEEKDAVEVSVPVPRKGRPSRRVSSKVNSSAPPSTEARVVESGSRERAPTRRSTRASNRVAKKRQKRT
jgi:U3 small nucleolar RNA-associated protein 13